MNFYEVMLKTMAVMLLYPQSTVNTHSLATAFHKTYSVPQKNQRVGSLKREEPEKCQPTQ